jgi:hypothetical protein
MKIDLGDLRIVMKAANIVGERPGAKSDPMD